MPLLLNSGVIVISLQWDKVAKYMGIWSMLSKDKDVINSFTAVLKGSNFMDQRLKGWESWGVFSTVLGLWWRRWSIHGITQCLRLTGTSGSYTVYSSCSDRAISSQLLQTLSRQLFSVFKGGDSTVPLANCARAQSPSQEKGVSWCSEGGNLSCFLLVSIVSGSITGLCLLCTLPSGIYVCWWDSP